MIQIFEHYIQKYQNILFFFVQFKQFCNKRMNVQEEDRYPVIGGLIIFISSFGVAGNVITLILMKKNQTFRDVKSQARLFLGNLAAVDLLNSILALLSGLGYINKDMIMRDHQILCYLTGYARNILPYIAVCSMTLLTANRYYTTISVERAEQWFQRKQAWICIICTWISLLLPSFVVVVVKSNVKAVFKAENGLCAIDIPSMRYIRYINVSLCTLCLLYMIFMNSRIWLFIRRYNRRIRDTKVINKLLCNGRNKKITVIVSVIFISHIICYLPLMVTSILKSAGFLIERTFWRPLAYFFYDVNHVNNVFIYGIMDKVYRTNVKRLFCSRNGASRVHPEVKLAVSSVKIV